MSSYIKGRPTSGDSFENQFSTLLEDAFTAIVPADIEKARRKLAKFLNTNNQDVLTRLATNESEFWGAIHTIEDKLINDDTQTGRYITPKAYSAARGKIEQWLKTVKVLPLSEEAKCIDRKEHFLCRIGHGYPKEAKIFSDWLEEQEKEHFAEFIRLQCALQEFGPGQFDALHEKFDKLHPKQKELLLKRADWLFEHREEWFLYLIKEQPRAVQRVLIEAKLWEKVRVWENGIPTVYYFDPIFHNRNEPKLRSALRKMSHIMPLKGFELDGSTRRTDFPFIKKFPLVEIISTPGIELEDPDMKALKQYPCLSTLDILGAQITDYGIKTLKDIETLESLDLSSTHLSNDGMEYLTELPNLKSLNISYTHVTDDGLQAFASMTQLESLSIYGLEELTHEGLKHLKHLTSLTILDVGYLHLTSAGIKEIAALTQLQKLRLWNTCVTNRDLSEIATLPELRYVDLRNTKATDKGMLSLLKEGKFPKLEILHSDFSQSEKFLENEILCKTNNILLLSKFLWYNE